MRMEEEKKRNDGKGREAMGKRESLTS